MKKYIYSFFAIACLTLMLSACGDNASDVSDAQIDDLVEFNAEEMDDEDIDDEVEPEEDSDEIEDKRRNRRSKTICPNPHS